MYQYFNMNIYEFGIYKMFLVILYIYIFYWIAKKPIYNKIMPYYMIFIDGYFLYLIIHNISITPYICF